MLDNVSGMEDIKEQGTRDGGNRMEEAQLWMILNREIRISFR